MAKARSCILGHCVDSLGYPYMEVLLYSLASVAQLDIALWPSDHYFNNAEGCVINTAEAGEIVVLCETPI